MADSSAKMAGEIRFGLNRRALASRLRAAGLRAEVRESCHYEGGRCIRISDGGDFTLERTADDGYLARADADTTEQLSEAASRVSAALAGLGIRHRFEVYDARAEMALYLHYLWPQVTGV